MRIKHNIIVLWLGFLCNALIGQEVKLTYQDLPLNDVLLDLSKHHNTQVSINASKANNCLITIDKAFENLSEAFYYLADYCQLEVRKLGGVYSFREVASVAKDPIAPAPRVKLVYLFQGVVIDRNTSEPLPFATLKIGDQTITSSENGHFSYKSNQSKQSIRLKYLGYYEKDTLLNFGSHLMLPLRSSVMKLNEVEVNYKPICYRSTGGSVGEIQLNDIASNLVPGNGSNLIFNTLRLYPGISASGESTSDYIIWGSYPGENNIVFDGVTLFHSRGINDGIGRVNPLIIKNIEVYKGAYNVDVADGVGGAIHINGKKGSVDTTRLKLSVNNQITGVYANLPFEKFSSNLQIAGRYSYYQLMEGLLKTKSNDKYFYPRYNFGDYNIKFNTYFNNNDQLQFSLLGSSDDYYESLTKEKDGYFHRVKINSKQTGGAFLYNKMWEKGGITSFQLSNSSYSTEYASESYFSTPVGSLLSDSVNNFIAKRTLQMTHQFPASRWVNMLMALAYVQDDYQLSIKTDSLFLNQADNSLERLSSFVKNTFQLGRLRLQPGLKLDIVLSGLQPFLQPRINGKYNLSDYWEIKFGSGLYRQYISKSLLTDNLGQRTFFWQTNNRVAAPSVNGIHNALSLSYEANSTELSVEGFFKTTSNINRYFMSDSISGLFHSVGESQSYGVDFLLKNKIGTHELLLAYSLGKVEERFEQSSNNEFTDAPQDQRHEIKLALLFRFKKLKISLNHVYGSGFNNSLEGVYFKGREPYSRFDLALEYDLVSHKFDVDLGLSVLNLFNAQNARLNQFSSFPDGSIAYASGVPFTPSLNLLVCF